MLKDYLTIKFINLVLYSFWTLDVYKICYKTAWDDPYHKSISSLHKTYGHSPKVTPPISYDYNHKELSNISVSIQNILNH